MIDQQLIIEKLDKIADKQAEMTAILAVQAEQLRIHVARTDALETLVQLHYEELYDEILPIRDHVSIIKGIGKALAALLALAGFVVALLKLFV